MRGGGGGGGARRCGVRPDAARKQGPTHNDQVNQSLLKRPAIYCGDGAAARGFHIRLMRWMAAPSMK